MTRYSPSRRFLRAGLAALAFAGFSAWCGLSWVPAFVPAVLLLASSGIMLYLASRPVIEIHEEYVKIGNLVTPWADIRRLDRTSWLSPLVVKITLAGNKRFFLVYPGDPDSASRLLRQLRRSSREALIDGVPYRQFWGEVIPAPERPQLQSPRYRLLRPEDEAEVERLYQRLKTVGRLDPKNSSDEK